MVFLKSTMTQISHKKSLPQIKLIPHILTDTDKKSLPQIN
jgi:hypothetical protein